MTLIKSISGIRGTIGGNVGENLTPIDIVKFTSAFASMRQEKCGRKNINIVIGRDARISGEMISTLVSGTLRGMGVNVIDLGLSTTPTVEIAIPCENADGGIILTASHNPKQWNALKLLNEKGEFISSDEGKTLLEKADKDDFNYAQVKELGKYTTNNNYYKIHIDKVLSYPLVDKKAIENANFKIAIDGINSTGGTVIPMLLKELGVKTIYKVHCDPTGNFAHNPEPLPDHLRDLSETIIKNNAHLGFAVDPDVDRLAIVSEDGEMFGEEYTLVAIADYFLKNKKGNTVSNLSSTQALKEITIKAGGKYFASAVGEVNVVELMKKENAIIGGEGNGGIIVPDFHYGRDALIGIGLFLTALAKYGKSCSMFRSTLPDYYISKNKIELSPEIDVDNILFEIQKKYSNKEIITIDGVKIIFENEWVHLRKSNTEPIIRIYSESNNKITADHLANKIIDDIKEIISSK